MLELTCHFLTRLTPNEALLALGVLRCLPFLSLTHLYDYIAMLLLRKPSRHHVIRSDTVTNIRVLLLLVGMTRNDPLGDIDAGLICRALADKLRS